MTKTQFLPIYLGRRYARSQYFWVQNFQGIHVFGFEFYPPYAHPRIQIYEVPLRVLESSHQNLLNDIYFVWFRGGLLFQGRRQRGEAPQFFMKL